jgi:hypothetical protein
MFIFLYLFSIILVIFSVLFCLSSITKIILVTSGIESIMFTFLIIFLGMLCILYIIFFKNYIENSSTVKEKFRRFFFLFFIILIFPLFSQLLEMFYLQFWNFKEISYLSLFLIFEIIFYYLSLKKIN